MERILSLASERGVKAEAFKTISSLTVAEVLNGKVESLDTSVETGLSVRVLDEGRLGFASTTDTGDEAVEEAFNSALAGSKFSLKDPLISFSGPSRPAPLVTYDRDLSGIKTEEKIAMAARAEEAAYKSDPRIKKTEKVSYSDEDVKTEIMTSEGLRASYHSNHYGLSCHVVAEEKGEMQAAFSIRASKHIDPLMPETVGREAAAHACELLNGRSISPQKLALVMIPMVGAQLLGAVSNLFSSDAVQKGRSLLSGKLGKKIASERVTVIDNGRLAGGLVSSPLDDEGILTGETVLAENGLLKGFLYNSYTAAREGKKSTGNGRRMSYRSMPDVAPSNLYFKPGKATHGEMVSGVTKGLYVNRVMGMHTVNPVSGEFSIGAAGVMIENGKKTFPVRGITIAGNLIDFLEAVEEVGNDLLFFPFSANFGSPTLLVGDIAVSG